MNNDKTKQMFVIDDNPSVKWPVVVRVPVSGGTFDDFQFIAQLRVLAAAEYEELLKGKTVEPAQPAGDLAASVVDVPVSVTLAENVRKFSRVVIGWEGITDKAGNAVPFTPEKLAEQITGAHGAALSVGIWRAIHEVRYGMRMNDAVEPGAQAGN